MLFDVLLKVVIYGVRYVLGRWQDGLLHRRSSGGGRRQAGGGDLVAVERVEESITRGRGQEASSYRSTSIGRPLPVLLRTTVVTPQLD
jgi:hypothetical protein